MIFKLHWTRHDIAQDYARKQTTVHDFLVPGGGGGSRREGGGRDRETFY
jgi:hypothetical protein